MSDKTVNLHECVQAAQLPALAPKPLRCMRVLVVEDSPTMRQLLLHIIDAEEDMMVVGEAACGQESVVMAKDLEPDVITMDVFMPDMNGLDATRLIMDQCPVPIIIVTSHAESRELNLAFEAMRAGALDVAAKPVGTTPGEAARWRRELTAKIRALADTCPLSMERAGNE